MQDHKPLAGKVALVTGAGRGIGREVALRLARDGATIVAHYAHSKGGVEQTVSEIAAAGGRAVAYQADISKRHEVVAMFDQIDGDPGHIDIVVNSSGVQAGGALAELKDEDIEYVIGINMLGSLYV